MPAISLADIDPLHRMAMRMARGLCRRLGLPAHEAEDFSQELLTDFLSRLPAYNAAQGPLAAFALVCFRHHLSLLAHRVQRHRTLHHAVSLDDPLPGGGSVGSRCAEADGYAAWMGQPVDTYAAVERRIDLERAVAVLPAEDLAICAALARGVPGPARHVGMSRTTAFRRVREVRLCLSVAGITSAA